mmetsp:Transcript_69772/g.196814  ORF Transcript_69772/g.196814 Transcript_69772/m.196814 type:complete len:476 (+) Transcript_69772:1600-3027(+)
MGAVHPGWHHPARVPRWLRGEQRDRPQGARDLLVGPLGSGDYLGPPHLLRLQQDPACHRDEQGGRHVHGADAVYSAGAYSSGHCRVPVVPSVGPLGGVRPVASRRVHDSDRALRLVRGGVRDRRQQGGVRKRLAEQRAPRLEGRGGLRRHEMLEVRAAALPPGLEVRRLLLHVPLEQRPAHRARAVHHRGLRRRLVLHEQRPERQSRQHQALGEERVPVPPRVPGLRRVPDSPGAVHPVPDAVPGETGGAQGEQDHAHHPQSPRVLPLVLREPAQVPQQERLHPDRPHGHELLHFRPEGLLLDREELDPLRHARRPGEGDPPHRAVVHHVVHPRRRVLPHQGDARRPVARGAAHRLRLPQLPGREALHERVRPRSGHEPPVLPHLRGDGGHRGRHLRAEVPPELPEGPGGPRVAPGGAPAARGGRARRARRGRAGRPAGERGPRPRHEALARRRGARSSDPPEGPPPSYLESRRG